MLRSLAAMSALIAVLTLMPAAAAQEGESPAPESPAAKKPAGPIIIAPESSKEGRAFFDQKRYAEAKPLLEKACNLGNLDSCGLLADLYYYGYGVAQDYEQTHLLDKQACDGGVPESCGNLGLL